MPNGKPGDHPLTDLLIHGYNVFGEEIDQLIKEIAEQDRRLINSIPDQLLFSSDQNKLKDHLIQIKNELKNQS